ncbi:MAG: hypothetical protein AAGJ82_05565 [Bacteroidota bacterium]
MKEKNATDPSVVLTELVEDHPDLAAGLHQFLAEETDTVVASVGVFTLLQLRLRAVLNYLPQVAPEDAPLPGASTAQQTPSCE